MADRILQAVAIQRELMGGGVAEPRIHDLIAKYARASLYRHPREVTERLRKQILKLMAKELVPLAQDVGIRSAQPILEGLEITKKGSEVRDLILRRMRPYHKANIGAFRAELERELGTLRGDIHAAFARAERDGVAKKQLIQDLTKAHQAEMTQLGKVTRRIDKAAEEVARGERRLARAGRRQRARARRQLAAAKKEHKLAKASQYGLRSFFARFATATSGQARDTIRREAQRAQYHTFRQMGFSGRYTWVAVNGGDACPQCEERHGRTHDERGWRTDGQPGDGQTYCGSACMCQLVPAAYAEGNETLAQPLRAA